MEPRIAIISTSINAAPAAYQSWAKQGQLIVAGDVNSPPELETYVNAIGGRYLSPQDQGSCPGSELLGWKNVQRRNAALWLALFDGFDYVVTVDDDNFPSDYFVKYHLQNFGITGELSTMSSRSGFVNPGAFCIPSFHARGVPYGVDTNPFVSMHFREENVKPRVVVSQAQVTGDPDCDAVERMVNAPNVVGVAVEAVISPGVYAAFNSQATVWTREWAPVMMVLPHIGRYDDIFASFLFARLGREYRTCVFYGSPTVQQHRNEHDLVKDLRAEYWGMSHVFDFVAALNAAHISSSMPLHMAYGELITAAAHVLPPKTVEFAQTWVRAWRELL